MISAFPHHLLLPHEGQSLYFYDCDNHLFELHSGTLDESLAAYKELDQKP